MYIHVAISLEFYLKWSLLVCYVFALIAIDSNDIGANVSLCFTILDMFMRNWFKLLFNSSPLHNLS